MRKCANLRHSIIYQTPAAFLFPPPFPPPLPPEEREQQRESRLQAREETSRGGSTEGGGEIPLSSAASLRCLLQAARSEEESGGSSWHFFFFFFFLYVASLQFLRLCHSAWSVGRAAERSIGDIAPQPKKSTEDQPGCLTT